MMNGITTQNTAYGNTAPMPSVSDYWDYSALAASYENRAPYHPQLIACAAKATNMDSSARVADIGAGTGRLTAAWAALGHQVDAVEPCKEMREIGQAMVPSAHWHARRGESTGLPENAFRVVSFGSSLNVVEPSRALAEASRLLQANGHLVVVYNHRILNDPLQGSIEQTIQRLLPGYSYGARRRDPTPTIEANGPFRVVGQLDLIHIHQTSAQDFASGFRAHATLQRQAGEHFPELLEAISELTSRFADSVGNVSVPFSSKAWLATRC